MSLATPTEYKTLMRAAITALRTLNADSDTTVRSESRMILRELVGQLQALATRNPNGITVQRQVAVTPTTPTAVACTFTISTDLVNKVAHGYQVGDCVVFPTVTTTTGLTAGTTPYFVIASGLTADAFKVSATKGGSAVDLATGDGTGTVRLAQLVTIDWQAGAHQYVTLTNNAKVVFANQADGLQVSVTFIQDATGSRLLSYGSTVLWPGGTVPTMTTTAAKADRLQFMRLNSNIYGLAQAQNL